MFNVYGPGQNLENLKQGMVSIYLAHLLQNKPIVVKGSLDRVRDFVFISDVVAAWQRALVRPVQGIFNLGTGIPTTVGSLLRKLLRAAGKPEDYPIHASGGTPGDQFALCANIAKVTRELDWEPSVSLDQGLESMVDWGEAVVAKLRG
jgi:UDP-glucose 4-epimerase